MTTPTLGRLEKVALREIWKSEAGDFTPWLAQADNLRLLGETLTLDLELESQEQEVGPFRADLLCKNTLDDSWVLVENQIARTDHTHLGQILTYAAGLDAVTVVWVAERFTDEHRAALDWLNEVTLDKLAFFGLEVEVWRIGDSTPAPKFNIVSKPNDWSREVKVSVGSPDLTPNKMLQLRYWTAFRTYMTERSKIRCSPPYPQNWMNHSLGLTGAHLASIASFWDSESNVFGTENRVDVYLDGPHAKSRFERLVADRAAIEQEVGQTLVWHNPEGARACRVYLRRSADITAEAQWPGQFEWLREHLERLGRVFGPRLKALAGQ